MQLAFQAGFISILPGVRTPHGSQCVCSGSVLQHRLELGKNNADQVVELGQLALRASKSPGENGGHEGQSGRAYLRPGSTVGLDSQQEK